MKGSGGWTESCLGMMRGRQFYDERGYGGSGSRDKTRDGSSGKGVACVHTNMIPNFE